MKCMDATSKPISRTIPVFPLPDLVLLPGALVPLRMFEPRYCEMTAHALSSDQMLALALLQPGFEPLYYTKRAPIHPTVCVGRIVASEQNDEGEYTILLQGLVRGRIEAEVDADVPYRQAQVALLEATHAADNEACLAARQQLRTQIEQFESVDSKLCAHWLKLYETPLELSGLVDLMAASLPVVADVKQSYLIEPDECVRARMLIGSLEVLAAAAEVRRRACRTGGLSAN